MSQENIIAACSSRSRPFLKRQCKTSDEPALIKKSKRSQKRNSNVAESGHDGDTKTMLLTDLPNEILGKILNQVSFDDLFNLEIVCKRLQKVVKSVIWPMKDSLTHESIIQYTNYPQIPPHVNIFLNESIQRHKITYKSVKAVLSRSKNIQNIDLSVYFLETIKRHPRFLQSLLSMTPKLITLDLSYIPLKKANLITIAHSCPMLEEITLANSLYYAKGIEDGIETLCKQCPNIKYMNLRQNIAVKCDFFKFILIGLRYLDIGFCRFTSNALMVLSQRVPNLETLILDYDFFKSTTNFDAFHQNLTKLKYLHINYIRPQSPFQSLNFTNFHELKYLSLIQNNLVTLETIESLQYCPKLKSLDLSDNRLDSNRVFETLKKCKALKFCNFSGWPNLNEGIIDFVQHNQIEYLDLINSSLRSNNIRKSLINECESLTYLVMGNEEVDYHKILLSVLSEKHSPPRKNILKIIIHSKMMPAFPTCKWCEIFPCIYSDLRTMPFPDLTSVQIQYQMAKNNTI